MFVSRGLSSQLRAIRVMDERDRLLALAQEQWRELDARLVADPRGLPRDIRDVLFPAPNQAVRWTLRAQALPARGTSVPLSELELTVRQEGASSAPLTLSAVYPTDWVPPEWF
ncbi:MAG: hypothetical protein HYY15_05270 [Candidatus Omnitrophica bacterium]|nr:hypothetical protein [Candidatus Omnitrophota bacterium]